MKNMLCLAIAVGSISGCSAVPTTAPTDDPTTNLTTADETCLNAGTSQDQINALRTLIENARNAGAVAEDVLSDASTSCEVCIDPDVDCDVTLCESCFTAIVNEIFAQQN